MTNKGQLTLLRFKQHSRTQFMCVISQISYRFTILPGTGLKICMTPQKKNYDLSTVEGINKWQQALQKMAQMNQVIVKFT